MKILIRILVTIAIHIFLYLIGSFIAWDFNPLHWWLFTATWSRILFTFMYLPCEFILIKETVRKY